MLITLRRLHMFESLQHFLLHCVAESAKLCGAEVVLTVARVSGRVLVILPVALLRQDNCA